MNDAIVRRNAIACETAKHPTCVCACGGAFHGAKHTEEWTQARLAELARVDPQLDWLEVDTTEQEDNEGVTP